MGLTNTQVLSLTSIVSGGVYASYASSGDYNDILNLLNAQFPTGNQYISRTTLKNILTTNGVYNTLLLASLNSSSPLYSDAVIFIKNIDSSDYPDFRLENPAVQGLISAVVTAGLMSSGDVAALEAQFTPEMTSIAQGILSRLATLDDITQVLGNSTLQALQSTLIPYAQTVAQSVLTPLQDAVNAKQAQISSYMQTLQSLVSQLQQGEGVTLPTSTEISTALS